MATTWLELRTRIRQRSDNEFTDGRFVTDAELLILANRSQKQLFGLLVEVGQHSVAETVTTLTVDGSLNYALPDDCFTVAGVFRIDSGEPYRLERHDQRTFPRDEVESVALTYRTHGRLEDSVIELNPRVDSGTYKVRYLPTPTDFALDADTIDGVLGWEEWIVLDVAIDIMTKEKQWESVDRLHGRMKQITRKIEAQAAHRDELEQGAIQDTRRGSQRNSLIDSAGYLPGGHRGVAGYYGGF